MVRQIVGVGSLLGLCLIGSSFHAGLMVALAFLAGSMLAPRGRVTSL